MSLELSEECVSGLTVDVDDEVFQHVVDLAIQVLLGKADSQALADIEGANPIAIKSLYASICMLVIEGSRKNAEVDGIRLAVEDAGVAPSKANHICDRFEPAKKRLRKNLGFTGLKLPHLTGVDWELDKVVCSSDDTRVGKPTYALTFVADTEEGEKEIPMVCDYLHLQDVIASLKNAIKQIERTTKEQ
eukprot:JZ551939.1.p1 GENE.JZ551939.1~~JZ551939.1.p1  ORF type:complete len:189 (+),score=29.27 JZ551939.1:59-625(+)